MKRFKLFLLRLLSVICSVAPVLVFFFINMDKYTRTVSETVKLTAGGMLLFSVVILKVLGKLRMPSGIVLFGIAFLLTYLLSAIINDIMIFTFLALLGEALSSVCDFVIKAQAKRLEREKTASITAEEIKKVIQGSGRV